MGPNKPNGLTGRGEGLEPPRALAGYTIALGEAKRGNQIGEERANQTIQKNYSYPTLRDDALEASSGTVHLGRELSRLERNPPDQTHLDEILAHTNNTIRLSPLEPQP